MSQKKLRINGDRLLRRLMSLAEVGAIDGGGVCRLALTDEDRAGRDLVIRWMRELGLSITIDRIGNVVGTRAGTSDLKPVVMGSGSLPLLSPADFERVATALEEPDVVVTNNLFSGDLTGWSPGDAVLAGAYALPQGPPCRDPTATSMS